MSHLLNNREAAKALGISERTFYRMNRLRQLDDCKVARPMAGRAFDAEKCALRKHGLSVSVFGRRRAS